MRSKSVWICVVLTVLLIVVLTNVVAGIERRNKPQVANETSESRAAPGVVQCVVTDDLTGQGVKGAMVEVIGTGLSKKTDRNGKVIILPVAPGSHTLAISHPDYVSATVFDLAVKSHARSIVSRTLEKVQRGRIVGVITDVETGEPVVGGSVMIVGTNNRGAMTDFDGQFVIDQLEVGIYDIRIGHLDYLSASVDDVEVRDREDTEVSKQLTRDPNAFYLEINVHSQER